MSAESSTCTLRKRRWPRLLTFFLLLVPCLLGANRAGVWVAEFISARHVDQIEPTKIPMVLITPESLDFGIPWETDAFSWNVVFQNTSDRTVILSDVRGACDCTKVTWKKDVLLRAGERLVVPLVIDLLQLATYDTAEARTVNVEIFGQVRQVGAQSSPQLWLLQGGVRRLVTCQPSIVGLSEELINGEQGRSLEFRLSPNCSINDLRLRKTPPGWSVHLNMLWAGLPQVYILQATPTKTRPGRFSDKFELEAVTADGKASPIQPIRVEGLVAESLEVLPRPLDLGVLHVGAIGLASFWVYSRNSESLQGVEVVPDDPDTRVVSLRRESGGWRVDLEQAINKLGNDQRQGVIRALSSGQETRFLLRWYATVK